MDSQILAECEVLAFKGKASFPEIARKLEFAGVERYCADLVRLEKFYYSKDGMTLTEPIPLKDGPAIGGLFLSGELKAAILAAQEGKINYPEFLRRVMKAGVVFYDVFINGRRIIYTGREGDFHVEPFPSGK